MGVGSHGIVHESESVVLTEVELERELTYRSGIDSGMDMCTVSYWSVQKYWIVT